MEKERAVVWDLDGVIVDSAEAHNLSWAGMASRFDLEYSPERDFRRIFGKHNTDIIGLLWGITDREKVAEMADAKEHDFREAAANLRALPGVMRLTEELARHGWRQAIGSSAPMLNIELLLRVTGLSKYMQAIASGDDVTRGKPDPQVFLLAFERLGVAPQDGVVIEDAPAGIEAGRRAGAATLGVTTTQTLQTLQAAGADEVVAGLERITVDDLEMLIQQHRAMDGPS